MARSIHPIVVGTAGHIDHGKSSLVKALTGIDPDRLKEEQERGLTIDLGFARLRLADGRWLGLVDVPGHERFVRNMVAGATGIDLALLVVAADDGVMPQTVEHVEILDLLEVRAGLVALTKVDLVDEVLADVAEDEVRQLLQGTALANAPILRVSSATGDGVPELRQALEQLALAVPVRRAHGAFRMPIQRVFSLPGIGTVVTGIPLSGTIQAGDEVEFLPLGARARVRGLHAYGGRVEQAVAGHSSALSVPDARDLGLARGLVCAAPGVFTSGDAVDVDLVTTARCPRLLHRSPIRFHTGTVEVRGELLLLDRDELLPSQRCVARLELDEPTCCAPNDRFLLRLQNPPATIGGGQVLRIEQTGRYRRRALGDELRGILAAGDRPEARVQHELVAAGPEGRPVDELARALSCDERGVLDHLQAMPGVLLHQKAMRAFLAEHVAAGERELFAAVDRMLAKRPAAASVQRSALRASKSLPSPLLDFVCERLQRDGRLRTGSKGRLLFVERLRPLPSADAALLERLCAECERRDVRPPDAAELAAAVGLAGDALHSLLDRAQDEGRVEAVGEHFYAAATIQRVCQAVWRNCRAHDFVLDIPKLRDELDTSRKYLIPLLEYVDALGLTVLRGGVRRLLPSSDLARELAAREPG